MAEGFGPQNKEQLLSTFCIQDSGLTSTQKLPNARPEDERARAAHARRQEAEAERVAEACRMAEEEARRAFVELAERAAEDEGKKPRLEIAFAAAEEDALRRADELFSMGCSVDQIRSLYGDIILMQLRLIPRMSDVHHEGELKVEADDLRLELHGARLRELTRKAVRAVAGTPEGLPGGFMPDDETEILRVLRDHSSKERDRQVEFACDLCTQYIRARDDLADCKVLVQNALFKSTGEEPIAVQNVTKSRDAQYQVYLEVSMKLLDACNPVYGLLDRVQKRNEATNACANRLFELLGVRACSVMGSSTVTTSVVGSVSLHDNWVTSKVAQGQGMCGQVQEAMTNLAVLLKAYSEVLLHCGDGPLVVALNDELKEIAIPEDKEMAIPEDISPLIVVLREHIAAKEMWVKELAREYQSSVTPALVRAAWVAISELHSDSIRFDMLIRAAADARAVVEYGENPHERVKQGLSEISSSIQTARDALTIATAERTIAEKKCDDKAQLHAEQQLSKANEDIRKLQQQQLKLWSDVYRLAAAAFPELPSQALKLCTTSNDGAETLSLCDPHAARLLAPTRQKDMYQGPNGKDPVIISLAGRDSRNDVFRAVYDDSDVCLKKFVLGRISKGGRQEELHVRVRTLQREINNVVKLAHDRVIKPALFFLQTESNGSLCAYVQYPWYPCGSMDTWLKTLPEGTDYTPKVRVVLWDVSKAIEHVHYHGIVHCDIKLANVLIEHRDGQHRGVLADFDLSKDLKNRVEASMSSMSVAVARGTAGCLTMAPEVLQRRQPDFKADCYSFGGMVLLALFTSQADLWQQGGDDKRWDSESGAPLLTVVQDEMAHSLLSQALHMDKDRRPTITQIVSDGFFSADISRAQDLRQELEKAREELEKKQADHSKAVREQQKRMADEEQRIAKEQDVLKADLNVRQAKLQREQEELERKGRRLADQGKLSRDEQKKVHDERKRLEDERTKISEEKRRREQDLNHQQQKLDQRMRDEEAKLVSERKKIEDQKKELEKKDREASQGLQVPPYWKNKTGMHFVATNFVRDALRKFMVESSCCPATKQARVVSVERVENESLWHMYQVKRKILMKNCAAQSIHSATRWQPDMPSKADMSTGINEFYLFHGTSSKNARFICEHGFDERMANLNGLYGAGSYFAINSCKSHQYSSQNKDSSTFVMLVCRVVMGSPYCTSTSHNGQRRPPDSTPGRPFDSIFAQHRIGRGGQQEHNEYVVFDRHQVYPEYIVRYTV